MFFWKIKRIHFVFVKEIELFFGIFMYSILNLTFYLLSYIMFVYFVVMAGLSEMLSWVAWFVLFVCAVMQKRQEIILNMACNRPFNEYEMKYSQLTLNLNFITNWHCNWNKFVH